MNIPEGDDRVVRLNAVAFELGLYVAQRIQELRADVRLAELERAVLVEAEVAAEVAAEEAWDMAAVAAEEKAEEEAEAAREIGAEKKD